MAAPTWEARAHSGPSYTTLLDSTTDDAFVASNGWFRIVEEAETSDAALGELVIEALDHSQWQVPAASVSGPEAFAKMLDALGLGSIKEYMVGAKEVSVKRKEGGLRLLQMVNQGDSFLAEQGDEERHLPLSASPEEIGRHAREILAL